MYSGDDITPLRAPETWIPWITQSRHMQTTARTGLCKMTAQSASSPQTLPKCIPRLYSVDRPESPCTL